MKLSEIKRLRPKDINRLSVQELKDAIKVGQYEQARRFKRMEEAGIAQQSPLYRGIEKELYEKGIKGPVSQNFKKLHNYKSNDQAVLRNELRDMIGIINRQTATEGGTKKYLKKEYKRLFGNKADKETFAWWESTGSTSFWDAYEKAKDEGFVSAYGSGETQTMIKEYESIYGKTPSTIELEALFLGFGSASSFREAYETRKDMEDDIFTDLS